MVSYQVIRRNGRDVKNGVCLLAAIAPHANAYCTREYFMEHDTPGKRQLSTVGLGVCGSLRRLENIRVANHGSVCYSIPILFGFFSFEK